MSSFTKKISHFPSLISLETRLMPFIDRIRPIRIDNNFWRIFPQCYDIFFYSLGTRDIKPLYLGIGIRVTIGYRIEDWTMRKSKNSIIRFRVFYNILIDCFIVGFICWPNFYSLQ